MTQKDAFIDGEGDQWFERNQLDQAALEEKIRNDHVMKALDDLSLGFSSVLEVGASNGWRLAALKKKHEAVAFTGLDPSAKAVEHGPEGMTMVQGSADNLPFEDASFDLVMFGFCLYLCDRRDLFKIAAEADRVLREGGHVLTYDFHTPVAYRNPYNHQNNLYSYKMNYGQMFSWNPSYKEVLVEEIKYLGAEDSPDNQVGVCVYRKDTEQGWIDNPYKES